MKPSALISGRGFTLLEVMLALAVFAIIAGGLFATVRSVLQATATMREAQRVGNGLNGAFELCRRTFSQLPSAATILSASYDGAVPPPYELDIENAPTAFTFGKNDFFYGQIAVTAHQDDKGLYTFGVEYRRLDPDTGLTLDNPLWVPLLEGLKEVRWSYYSLADQTWYDTWTDNARPTLVALYLMRDGDPNEYSQIFWLPTLAAQPSFSQGSPGGGGGGGNRGGNGNGNRNGGPNGNGNANGGGQRPPANAGGNGGFNRGGGR